MTEQERDDVIAGEYVDSMPVEPLRASFARALGALMDALPPGRPRDIAVEQVMGAHQRAEELLRRYRVIN